LVTSLVTALKAAVVVLATTVVRRVIASKTALTLARSSAATATQRVTRAETVLNPETGPVSSAPTARRWAIPRSGARSPLLLRRTATLNMEEVTQAAMVVMAASLATLKEKLLVTPAAAVTSAELLLAATAGVVANLLLLAEAGKFLSTVGSTCCRLTTTA
jgi:hypothetical protein